MWRTNPSLIQVNIEVYSLFTSFKLSFKKPKTYKFHWVLHFAALAYNAF